MNGRLRPPGEVPRRQRDQVLRLTGELDISVRDVLDRAISDHVARVTSSVVVLDLSAVTFMDSSGLDVLLRAHVKLAEQERVLALQPISAPVRRLFRLLAGLRPYGLVQQTLRGTSRRVEPSTAADEPELPDGREATSPGGRGATSSAQDLQGELAARDLLNETVGLLMAVHDCDAGQARLLLELVSGRRGVAVADLAAGIVTAVEATRIRPRGVGLAAMVPADVRAALGSRVPAARTGPGRPR